MRYRYCTCPLSIIVNGIESPEVAKSPFPVAKNPLPVLTALNPGCWNGRTAFPSVGKVPGKLEAGFGNRFEPEVGFRNRFEPEPGFRNSSFPPRGYPLFEIEIILNILSYCYNQTLNFATNNIENQRNILI